MELMNYVLIFKFLKFKRERDCLGICGACECVAPYVVFDISVVCMFVLG